MALFQLTSKGTFKKTVTAPGTAEAITTDQSIIVAQVVLKAGAANTGIMYIGDSAMSQDGFELAKGESISTADFISEIQQRDIQITPTGIFVDADNGADVLEVLLIDIVKIA